MSRGNRTGNKRSQKPTKKSVPAFAKVKQSPFYAEIVERLSADQDCNAIALWLRSVDSAFEGQAPSTIARQLQRFWAAMGKKGSGTALQTAAAAAIAMPLSVPVPKEITILEDLLNMQVERIESHREVEKEANFLMPGTRHEMAEARSLLHLLLSQKRELNLLEGIGPAAPAGPHTLVQNNVTVNALPQDIAAVVNDPASRHRVLEALRSSRESGVTEDEAFRKRFQVRTMANPNMADDAPVEQQVVEAAVATG